MANAYPKGRFQVELTGVYATSLSTLGKLLHERGYRCDEHYEWLYGRNWELIGVRLFNAQAAQVALTMAVPMREVAL